MWRDVERDRRITEEHSADCAPVIWWSCGGVHHTAIIAFRRAALSLLWLVDETVACGGLSHGVLLPGASSCGASACGVSVRGA